MPAICAYLWNASWPFILYAMYMSNSSNSKISSYLLFTFVQHNVYLVFYQSYSTYTALNVNQNAVIADFASKQLARLVWRYVHV